MFWAWLYAICVVVSGVVISALGQLCGVGARRRFLEHSIGVCGDGLGERFAAVCVDFIPNIRMLPARCGVVVVVDSSRDMAMFIKLKGSYSLLEVGCKEMVGVRIFRSQSSEYGDLLVVDCRERDRESVFERVALYSAADWLFELREGCMVVESGLQELDFQIQSYRSDIFSIVLRREPIAVLYSVDALLGGNRTGKRALCSDLQLLCWMSPDEQLKCGVGWSKMPRSSLLREKRVNIFSFRK